MVRGLVGKGGVVADSMLDVVATGEEARSLLTGVSSGVAADQLDLGAADPLGVDALAHDLAVSGIEVRENPLGVLLINEDGTIVPPSGYVPARRFAASAASWSDIGGPTSEVQKMEMVRHLLKEVSPRLLRAVILKADLDGILKGLVDEYLILGDRQAIIALDEIAKAGVTEAGDILGRIDIGLMQIPSEKYGIDTMAILLLDYANDSAFTYLLEKVFNEGHPLALMALLSAINMGSPLAHRIESYLLKTRFEPATFEGYLTSVREAILDNPVAVQAAHREWEKQMVEMALALNELLYSGNASGGVARQALERAGLLYDLIPTGLRMAFEDFASFKSEEGSFIAFGNRYRSFVLDLRVYDFLPEDGAFFGLKTFVAAGNVKAAQVSNSDGAISYRLTNIRGDVDQLVREIEKELGLTGKVMRVGNNEVVITFSADVE